MKLLSGGTNNEEVVQYYLGDSACAVGYAVGCNYHDWLTGHSGICYQVVSDADWSAVNV